MPERSEIRLRLVEALTRTDGSMARTDTVRFTQAVAEIERFVLQGDEPKAETLVEKPDKANRPKRDAKAEKSEADFMD